MGIEQVAFEVPAAIQAGLESGSLIRYGGVVRDAAGHIVAHLKEIPVTKDVISEMMADQIANVRVGEGGKLLEFAKKNKYAIAGITLVAIIGTTAYCVHKAKGKKKKKVDVPECVATFNEALIAYIDAIRNESVTKEVIDRVLIALDEIKENQERKIIDGDFAYENAGLLTNMIREYTQKLSKANNFRMDDRIPPRRDNIVDIRTYLNMQKEIFEQAQ